VRCNRVADSYVWLSIYILDAQCSLGMTNGHPSTPKWVESMLERSARTGMREFLVRAMLHRAALGHHGDADAATVLANDIDNPQLRSLVHAPFRPERAGHRASGAPATPAPTNGR
jgi:hypothetical protein